MENHMPLASLLPFVQGNFFFHHPGRQSYAGTDHWLVGIALASTWLKCCLEVLNQPKPNRRVLVPTMLSLHTLQMLLGLVPNIPNFVYLWVEGQRGRLTYTKSLLVLMIVFNPPLSPFLSLSLSLSLPGKCFQVAMVPTSLKSTDHKSNLRKQVQANLWQWCWWPGTSLHYITHTHTRTHINTRKTLQKSVTWAKNEPSQDCRHFLWSSIAKWS